MEVLVAITFIAILSYAAVSNIKSLENPLADASFQVSHFLRLARSRAISQTIAIQLSPSSSTGIAASSSDSCSGTMTPMDDLSLTLPDGAFFVDTAWTACFTQRGLADDNIVFDLQNQQGSTRTIELALGGGVQIR